MITFILWAIIIVVFWPALLMAGFAAILIIPAVLIIGVALVFGYAVAGWVGVLVAVIVIVASAWQMKES